ncbi:MAG TPA: LutB/LldF family L-lactate oxidation iron-sulfur protein [Miltoncostaeaceae bacterium]|nr:LutB/LldF family L-lactate oxidation iron-sulfur protein [Miltoncostaeaceae bacterium]
MTTLRPDPLTTSTFRERARAQLAKPFLREAVPKATDHAVAALRTRFADHDYEALRELGRAIRAEAIADLDRHLADLEQALVANGVRVHHAADAGAARDLIRGIVRDAGGRTVVKVKSMATEEIDLNPALAADGVRVVETDLGEYVVQLDGDRPSHIIAPIIHKTRGEVRESLSRAVGRELPDDAAALTGVARAQLRDAFMEADVGISGANFGVADTGTICLVTNEGNGRMCTSLPRVHIALMGVERVVPRMTDLAVLLPLLTGAGTGQLVTSYVNLLSGPRRPGEPDGPEEMHVVLLDNGRRALRGTPYEEVLHCIRCGACQNVCPVYRQVGGHAYGWVYGGPIGAVLTPLFRGQRDGGELSQATSLCGACDDVCPVKIPLHDLLLSLRRDRAAAGVAPRGERIAARLWSWAWAHPATYRLSVRLARAASLPARHPAVARRLPLAGRWAAGRTLPRPARRPYHRRLR